MRLAAIYDIHGNFPALEAVLREIRAEEVDMIVFGGDALPGPMPAETLDSLSEMEIPTRFIHGNGDRVVLAAIRGQDISEVPGPFQEGIRWTARQLSAEHAKWLEDWSSTLSLAIDGLGEVLFCHATPRNDTECFTRMTPEERLLPVLAGVRADLVVCGHTHMQFDRNVIKTRVVNAGSVGMPFARPAGAHWLLLDTDVTLRQTSYDLDAAAQRMRETGYPMVENTVLRYVLDPPSEEESLRLFSQAELR